MVFYASAHPHDRDQNTWRYIITGSSVEAVDEWSRSVQDAGCEIHRKAPDFYTYQGAWYLWDHRLTKDKELKENIKVTRVNDAPSGRSYAEWSWPGQFAPDHTSGKACYMYACSRTDRSYIRSKSDPSIFWYESDGFIVPSKTQRTKFRVTGLTRSERDHVIIPSDQIRISLVDRDGGHVRNDNGILVVGSSGGDIFHFRDFKQSFLPVGSGEDSTIKKIEFDGDEWELAA